jgi:hypothetical protein
MRRRKSQFEDDAIDRILGLLIFVGAVFGIAMLISFLFGL